MQNSINIQSCRNQTFTDDYDNNEYLAVKQIFYQRYHMMLLM